MPIAANQSKSKMRKSSVPGLMKNVGRPATQIVPSGALSAAT
jgi:hypothetical protein